MKFQRFTKKNIIVNTLLVTLYLLWSNLALHSGAGSLFLSAFWLVMFYAHQKTRRFILGFSIFILYWIIYDSMRILPNYQVNTVHIKQPYIIEKSLFGVVYNNKLLTPNEYFDIIHTKTLDIIAGLFYLNWVPVPLAFAFYLYFKNKELFINFSLTFLLVNIAGFIIYYLYPAAPPWYVKIYGFDLHIGVPGNTAGLGRFDALTGINVFSSLYGKNANVLAAMPSLHASYPVVVLYYALKNRMKAASGFFVIFMLGIWFSAVYSGHHYIIDVLAGLIIAITVIFAFEKISNKKSIKKHLENFSKII